MKTFFLLSLLSLSTFIFSACSSSSDTTTTTIDDNSTTTDDNSTTTSASALSYTIADTNQVDCYDSTTGSAVTCTGSGVDADYTGNTPSYTLSSSGDIVTDNVTGLMWTQSSDVDGDGVTTDMEDQIGYDASITYCSDLELDGYTDWRLPDVKTLYSLILFSGEDASNYTGTDTSALVPFLDSSFEMAFGDQDRGQRVIDGQYATTTKYVSTTMYGNDTMFGVNFVDGRIKGYATTKTRVGVTTDSGNYVLCTRGNEDYGKNDFVDNSDDTITDNATALMWEKNDAQSTDFDNAITMCEASTTGSHSDWRLPNTKELQSIIDYTRSPDTNDSAAIDPIFNATSFQNEENVKDWGWYWASTSHVDMDGNGEGATYLSFGRALGVMTDVLDVHGAGAQRSNKKTYENVSGATSATDASDGSTYYYHGPQGDILRIDNMLRCVRDTF